MRNIFRSRRWRHWQALWLVLAAIGLIILDAPAHRPQALHKALSWTATPLVQLVAWPSAAWQGMRDQWRSQQALLAENTALRGQTFLLQAKVRALSAALDEQPELKALLASSLNLNGRVLVGQRLAVGAAALLRGRFLVDRGLNAGVYEGQPVMDSLGVVGQVVAPLPTTSWVMGVTHAAFAMPVQVVRTGFKTIAAGLGDGEHMQLLYVPDTAAVRPGDAVVSSGLGQRFPVGYPVGKIIRVERLPGQRFMRVLLQPEVRVQTTRFVLLLNQV